MLIGLYVALGWVGVALVVGGVWAWSRVTGRWDGPRGGVPDTTALRIENAQRRERMARRMAGEGPTAPAGRSNHETGMAIDLNAGVDHGRHSRVPADDGVTTQLDAGTMMSFGDGGSSSGGCGS